MNAEMHLAAMAESFQEVTPETKNRRRERRYPANSFPALVTIVDPPVPADVWATILNVSRTGLGIRLEKAVANGSTVEVRFESVIVRGVVRWHRTTSDGGCEAGISIQDVNLRTDSPAERNGRL